MRDLVAGLILAKENVSRTVIDGLRAKGHDVLSVKESLRGEKDEAILARAQNERRIVLTHDKDFGELAFRIGLSADCGVMLLRLSGTNRMPIINGRLTRSKAVPIGKAISR